MLRFKYPCQPVPIERFFQIMTLRLETQDDVDAGVRQLVKQDPRLAQIVAVATRSPPRPRRGRTQTRGARPRPAPARCAGPAHGRDGPTAATARRPPPHRPRPPPPNCQAGPSFTPAPLRDPPITLPGHAARAAN